MLFRLQVKEKYQRAHLGLASKSRALCRGLGKEMAIYHLSVKPVQRSKGRSATAAAAYRAGEKVTDERTGEEHDYGRKKGILYKEIITPDGSDITREKLWNMAEAAEKRKDGTTAREYEIALPSELPEKARIELAREFARKLARVQGVAVDICIHAPSLDGDSRNLHAHLLATTRIYEGGKLGKKSDFDLSDRDRKKKGLDSRKEELHALRAEWAYMVNAALDKAQVTERVTHKSLAAQGIERAPSIHLGPTATAMERRGIRTERGNLNRAAIAPSPEQAELASLERQQQGIHAAKQRLRIEKAARAAAKAESERQRIRQEAERQRQREEAERRQKEAERQRLEEEKQRTEARTLFARYVRGLGGTAEQQAAQVQRMLTAWEQQAAQERAAILSETRQSIEQRERAQNERQRSRGPRMGR